MAYTDIDDPSAYFQTALYNGTGGSHSITNTGNSDLQPDWVWVKSRSASVDHELFDSVRGAGKALISNGNYAESSGRGVNSFDSDGFSLVNAQGATNDSGRTYVGWNWKANGAGSANTDGSINSTVSANTTSGFSIVSYTGTGSNATIGHGLGAVPKMIITKALGATNSWGIYHASLGNDKYLYLDSTQAALSATAMWNDTTPTSSVFSVGTSGASNASGAMIAYCFAEKTGYSKIGSYTGNGNADGSFIYTGFKPAWLLIKRSDASTERWVILDSKRDTFNVSNKAVYADDSQAENPSTSEQGLDILSNGFKIRNSNTKTNTSGATYIYMAFAEAPLVGSNNVPCTAR